MPEQLATIRRRRLLSQAALAKAAGVATRTVASIELGHVKPRFAIIRKLSETLQVDPMEVAEFRRAIDANEGKAKAA